MSEPTSKSFAQAGAERDSGLVGEFVGYLKDNRKFWLVPLLLVLFGMGVLIVLGGTAAAPFIYTLF
jgi:Family of unknown function (DUF5989)